MRVDITHGSRLIKLPDSSLCIFSNAQRRSVVGLVIRFGNFEGTAIDLQKSGGSPSALAGASWLISTPAVAQDSQQMGFNLIRRANNLTTDRGIPRIAHGADAERILQRLQRLSRHYGTEIVIENELGLIRLA
jgi:hypothetical protein